MRHAKCVPDDNILVAHILVTRSIIGNTILLLEGLISPLTAGPEIAVAVTRDPEMMLSETGAFANDRVLAREQKLARLGNELESNRIS